MNLPLYLLARARGALAALWEHALLVLIGLLGTEEERAEAEASVWPRMDDLWKVDGGPLREYRVERLETRGGVNGVRVWTVQGTGQTAFGASDWYPMDRWQRMTSRMVLVERAGMSVGVSDA